MGGRLGGDPVIVGATPAVLHPSANTPEERAVADRLAGRNVQRIGVPVGTDIRASDRLIEPSSGRAFEVVQPIAATNAAELLIICVEE